MHTLSGSCHCGNIAIEVNLTAPPETFSPRACDCDYCCKHGAAWLSDAKGSLRFRIREPDASARYRQGSGQAEMLLCRNCGVLVGALYRHDQRLYGVVNVRALDGAAGFGADQPVSPRKLSPAEKAGRWENIWFSDVECNQGGR